MVLESFQCCRLCLRNPSLLRQRCGFREVIRRLSWDLLRDADDADIQRKRQNKKRGKPGIRPGDGADLRRRGGFRCLQKRP